MTMIETYLRKYILKNDIMSGSSGRGQLKIRQMCATEDSTMVECFGIKNETLYEDEPVDPSSKNSINKIQMVS